MKKLIAALGIMSMLTLTGCSSEQGGKSAVPVPHIVKLADGRSVDCIVVFAGYAGGLSCDWGGAK